jgi:hypothetical protein
MVHRMHLDAPEATHFPAGQLAHKPADSTPTRLENVPAGHGLHSIGLSAYMPVPHEVHAPCPAAVATRPGVHEMQSSELGEPVAGLYVPSMHSTHGIVRSTLLEPNHETWLDPSRFSPAWVTSANSMPPSNCSPAAFATKNTIAFTFTASRSWSTLFSIRPWKLTVATVQLAPMRTLAGRFVVCTPAASTRSIRTWTYCAGVRPRWRALIVSCERKCEEQWQLRICEVNRELLLPCSTDVSISHRHMSGLQKTKLWPRAGRSPKVSHRVLSSTSRVYQL